MSFLAHIRENNRNYEMALRKVSAIMKYHMDFMRFEEAGL